MTYEQMKFRLGDYVRCRRFYERHRRELILIEQKLKAVGISIDYSKPNVKTSAPGNAAYADWITDAMFIRKQLAEEETEVVKARDSVNRLINMLTDLDQKDVLRYKYVMDWQWREIGKIMGYSPDWVRHKSYEAVKCLAEKTTTHNHY